MMINIVTQIDLGNLCKALLAADSDIRDIILFGSFAYAPSLAQDIDLVVTTANLKDYDVYLDAVADFPLNVDVIVRQPSENIGDRIAWGIRAVGQVLVGNGETLKEVMKIPAPTFERARKIFARADENLLAAQNAQDLDIKDEAY
jgi:predicted nucleotidyltransferase